VSMKRVWRAMGRGRLDRASMIDTGAAPVLCTNLHVRWSGVKEIIPDYTFNKADW
jgi:hypothetical protein